MRNLLTALALLVALSACQSDVPEPDVDPTAPDQTAVAGDGYVELGDVPAGEALEVAALAQDPASYAGEMVVVRGTVREVCQMKGCWLTLQGEGGESIRVTVPKDESGDYAWTFPKDARQDAVLAGTFAFEETGVDMQRHYAEDGGASEEEVAAITEPKREMTLAASGARVQHAVATEMAPTQGV
jgi:hypothetical protein